MTTAIQSQPLTSRLARALDLSTTSQAPTPSSSSPSAAQAVQLSGQEPNAGSAPGAGYLQALTSTWAAPTTKPEVAAPPALKLPSGYQSLSRLSDELSKRDPRFSSETAQGRAAKALALAIGGTEVYGRGSKGKDFFTRRGGTDNNMLGFGQFNLAYHRNATNTPSKYTRFMGDILTGQARMPNGRRGSNHAQALSQAVASGKVKNGADFRKFMLQRGFGGSNWQAIDDGWHRVPGLAESLVKYLRSGS